MFCSDYYQQNFDWIFWYFWTAWLLYNCGMIFFILSFFIGYILSFGLVRLRTIWLSARAHIEYSSCLHAEDVTITDVMIKTPDGTGVWMTSCLEAMGWEFWWFWKEAVSWDLKLGKASPVCWLRDACTFVELVSWDSDSGPRIQLGSWLKGDVETVSIVKIVSLSPRVEKLKVKKS